MAGDLELTGSVLDFDEFTGAATANSPTYVVGQSGLDHMRHYIGYSYGDPNGGNKAQFLQFNNLVVGKQYTFYVQPSSIAGDGNCFYATAESGAVISEGGCKGWLGNPINTDQRRLESRVQRDRAIGDDPPGKLLRRLELGGRLALHLYRCDLFHDRGPRTERELANRH